MKLPRWLVVSMLGVSVLAVVAAAGWWWITWPQRTIREFSESIVRGKFEQTNPMLVGATWEVGTDGGSPTLEVVYKDGSGRYGAKMSLERWQSFFREPPLKLHARTPADMFRGRQFFHTDFHPPETVMLFAAERGKIEFQKLATPEEAERQ